MPNKIAKIVHMQKSKKKDPQDPQAIFSELAWLGYFFV